MWRQSSLQGTIFFSSNGGGALGFSGVNNENQVFRVELGDVASLAEGQLCTYVSLYLLA